MTPPPVRAGSQRRRFGALLIGGLAAVAGVGGCAIPVDPEARPVANPPTDLGNTTTSTLSQGGVPDFSLDLYFVNQSDQLVRVRRPRDTLASAQDALTALANPTDDEINRYKTGLTSKLGPLVFRPQGPAGSDGVLEVRVDGDELRGFVDTAANRVNRIYAQIVCTLTTLDRSIQSVQIIDAAGPIPVKITDAPETRPIGRGDFSDCAVAPSTATTTSTTGGGAASTGATPSSDPRLPPPASTPPSSALPGSPPPTGPTTTGP